MRPPRKPPLHALILNFILFCFRFLKALAGNRSFFPVFSPMSTARVPSRRHPLRTPESD
jgi:hypothetical protein